MFSFLISNSEALQSPELRTFLLSEIVKRPLNYHLMVILPATCRLQNPITTLNERHFFMATISLYLHYSFLKMIIWLRQEGHHTRPKSQSRPQNSSQAPYQHIAESEWLQRMERFIKRDHLNIHNALKRQF